MRRLVAEQRGVDGANRWAEIAKYLPGRNGKQCRERWHNQLDPAIRKDAWTSEEDATLIAKQVRAAPRAHRRASHVEVPNPPQPLH